MPTDRERVLVRFSRDLSTRTEEEVAGIWSGRNLKALEVIRPGLFDRSIRDHNPIYYLALRCWFDNDPSLLWEPFHKDKICKTLLDFYFTPKNKYSGLIILAQRDSFKTTFCHGVFAQFLSLRARHVDKKDIRIGLCHHAEPMAMENLSILKAKSLNHPWLKENWPEFCSDIDFDSSKKFDWPCKTEGVSYIKDPSARAFSNKSSRAGGHMDWKLNDDLVTEEHIKSKIIREEAFLNYRAGRDLIDTKVGKEVNTGTYYHVHDMWNKLVKSGRYQVLVIEAGGKDTNEPLSFPTRHTQEFLDNKRAEQLATDGSDMMYWLQYQLRPKTKSLVAGDIAWIQRCSLEHITERTRELGIVIICDPAWKGTKNSGKGDYAAIAAVGFERRGVLVYRYLLELTHSNEMTANDGIDEIFRLMQKWGTNDVAPEEHGGHTFRTMLENEAGKRGKWLNLIELKSKQLAKAERITSFMGHVEQGHFFIVDGCEAGPFLSEFEDYPQTDHDDALDAVAYSCDKHVTEMYTPNFGFSQGSVFEPPREPQRTRHTTV